MSKLPRRSFLACAAAPFVVRVADARPAPSERITLGMIGVGSMGLRHVQGFLQEPDCQILSICDVDAARRRAAAELVNKHYGTADCRQTGDFREAIADPGLDALVISVPDHWHAAASSRRESPPSASWRPACRLTPHSSSLTTPRRSGPSTACAPACPPCS